jgi:hypothetical protein
LVGSPCNRGAVFRVDDFGKIIMYRFVQRMAALGIALSGALVGSTLAAEFRSRPPHVHGLATLEIAVEDTIVAITFRAPAINVIGFEHAPISSEEKAALIQANATFSAGDRLFVAPAEAGCAQHSSALTPIAYETDGEDDKPNGPQADYEVTYRFACLHPNKLAWIDTSLFSVLRNVQKITANVVTSWLQQQVELVPGQRRIRLQPE